MTSGAMATSDNAPLEYLTDDILLEGDASPDYSALERFAVEAFVRALLGHHDIGRFANSCVLYVPSQFLAGNCRILITRLLEDLYNESTDAQGRFIIKTIMSVEELVTPTFLREAEHWRERQDDEDDDDAHVLHHMGQRPRPVQQVSDSPTTDWDPAAPDFAAIEQVLQGVSKHSLAVDKFGHRIYTEISNRYYEEQRELRASAFSEWGPIVATFSYLIQPFRRLTPSNAVGMLSTMMAKLSRPRLGDGYTRITWTCGCGKAMYSDVRECYDGGAAKLEQEIREAANAATGAQQGQSKSSRASSNSLERTSSQGSSRVSSTGSQSRPPSESGSSSRTAATGVTSPDGSCSSQARQGQAQDQFLLLCVNGARLVQLEQIPLIQGQNDQILFQDIRRAYGELRSRRTHSRSFHRDCPWVIQKMVLGCDQLLSLVEKQAIWMLGRLKLGWMVWWIGDSVFYVPKSANFVRFELVPVKMNLVPEILEFPCLPPPYEVAKQNYHYAPCPGDVENPLLRYPYLHDLFEPGNHLDRFWTNRSPKKLRERLQYQDDNGQPVIGWGVHIIEGPNWHALVVLTILFVLAASALSIAYAVALGDASSGFTMGSFLLGAETILLTLTIAIIIHGTRAGSL